LGVWIFWLFFVGMVWQLLRAKIIHGVDVVPHVGKVYLLLINIPRWSTASCSVSRLLHIVSNALNSLALE